MPLKSVFSIELDDSKFKQFKKLFDQYQEALAALPAGWEEVNKSVDEVNQLHQEISGNLENHVRLVLAKIAAEERSNKTLVESDNRWRSISQSIRNMDRSLEQGTIRLAKFGLTATGVLGGLSAIGIGGSLFGIDRLAGVVAAGRRTAMGLGTSYGELRSFDTNYSRLLGSPQGLLSNVATAKYDLTSPQYTALLTAGVNPQTLNNGSTAQITNEFLDRLPKIFDKIPQQFRGTYAKAYGIDQLMPMEDLNAFLNASPQEREQIKQKNLEDAKTMDLSKQTQKAWQDFVTQLERATKQVEATFMEKLAPIEPGLESLSASAVKLVAALADSGFAKTAIDDLSSGIDWLAGKVKEKSFQDDVSNWFVWIGQSAKSLWNLISGFQLISPAAAGETPAPKASTEFEPGDVVGPGGVIIKGDAQDKAAWWRAERNVTGPTSAADYSRSSLAGSLGGGKYNYAISSGSGELTKLITKASEEEGIDPRIMEGIRAGESAHTSRYDVKDDSLESSWGPFQLNRREGLGVQFEQETGLDVRDPSTIPAQAKWVAHWIKEHKTISPWMGFHGLRDADPHWGDSGYNPIQPPKDNIRRRPARPVTPTPTHQDATSYNYFPTAARMPMVTVRNNTGNDAVLATVLTSQPSTSIDKAA